MGYATCYDGVTIPGEINVTLPINGSSYLYCSSQSPVEMQIDAYLQIVTPSGNRLISTDKAYISTEEVFTLPSECINIFDQTIYLAFTPSLARQLSIYAYQFPYLNLYNPNNNRIEMNTTVTAVSQQILPPNVNRKNYTIVSHPITSNPLEHIVWIAKTPNQIGIGLPLFPNGSSITLYPDWYDGALYAVSQSPTDIYIEEVT